jgi:hypothetical protein
MSQLFETPHIQLSHLLGKNLEEQISELKDIVTAIEDEPLPPYNDLMWRSAEEVARTLRIGDLVEFQRIEDKRYIVRVKLQLINL